MTIRELLRTLWFGRWLIVASVVVVMFGAVFYQSRQDTFYEANAIVEYATINDPVVGEEASAALPIDPNPSVVESRAVAERVAEALGRPADVAELASQTSGLYSTENNQVVIRGTAIDPQVAQTIANSFAAAYIDNLELLWEGELAQVDLRLEALRDRYDELSARLAADPGDPFIGVERETVIRQYAALSAQKSGARSVVNAGWIVEPASSSLPLGYGSRSVLAAAALVGLLIGVGLAFARRGLDMRVRSAGDASHLASVPVLAEIYDIQGAQRSFRGRKGLPVSSRIASPFTESIRELRTAAQVALGGGQHPSIVVVTAADPDAPRSFLAANLAASWALSGRSTIALSGDLRRPKLDNLLPPPEGWRRPTLGPDDPLIRPTQVPNLRVCELPDAEMDPADYLATDWTRTFIESLRDRADVVVIDAPPVLAAADATILGGYSDGAVIVASSGRTDREVLAQAADRLRTGHIAVLGVAFAGVKGQSRVLYASTYGEPEEGEEFDAEPLSSEQGVLDVAGPGNGSVAGGALSAGDREDRLAPVPAAAGADPEREEQPSSRAGRRALSARNSGS